MSIRQRFQLDLQTEGAILVASLPVLAFLSVWLATETSWLAGFVPFVVWFVWFVAWASKGGIPPRY